MATDIQIDKHMTAIFYVIDYIDPIDLKNARLINMSCRELFHKRFWEAFMLVIDNERNIFECTEFVSTLLIKTGISNEKFTQIIKAFPNLQTLIFGDTFNQKIDTMANGFPNLQALIFGNNFDQKIDVLAGSFPKLQILIFGYYFNQDIDLLVGSFPNLHTLIFGSLFNKNIDALINSLPNLQILRIIDKSDNNIKVIADGVPKIITHTHYYPKNIAPFIEKYSNNHNKKIIQNKADNTRFSPYSLQNSKITNLK